MGSDESTVLELALRRVWLQCRDYVLACLTTAENVATIRAEREEMWAERQTTEQRLSSLRRTAQESLTPHPLDALATRFGLEPFDVDILLLALAPRIDLSFVDLFQPLKEKTLNVIEVDTALSVFCTTLAERLAGRLRLAPTAPLRRHGLIFLETPDRNVADPLLSAALRAAESIVRMLLEGAEIDGLDHDNGPSRQPRATFADLVLPEATVGQLQTIAACHRRLAAADERCGILVMLQGPPGSGKTLAAEALAHGMARTVLDLNDERLFATDRSFVQNLDGLLSAAGRTGAVVLVDDCHRLLDKRVSSNPHLTTLLNAFACYPGPIVICTAHPDLLDEVVERHIIYKIILESPPVRLREQLWQRLAQAAGAVAPAGLDYGYLARKFEFSGGSIRNAALVAAARACSRGPGTAITMDDLLAGAGTQLRHRLTQYAERHLTHLRLDDLILPDDVLQQVREVLDAVRARPRVFEEWGFAEKLTSGRGLSCLFDGEPGTGKTLCAEIIAAELGLMLYRINVAQVVDKYVGETEKNLTRVFKEASAAHSLLLFDEADALFASRVQANNAQDRFANLEINVLLQLMERYNGVVALTTNLKQSIDKAFERRLSYKISFPFPSEEFRERIWAHLIPARTPVAADVEPRALARAFELSGGSIKNALVRAAYRAATGNRPITMADLAEAARRECIASGKLYRSLQPEDDD